MAESGVVALHIASGAAISSDSFKLPGRVGVLAFICEGAWTAADLQIEGSKDGSNWVPLRTLSAALGFGSLSTSLGWGACFLANEIFALWPFPYLRVASVNSSTRAAVNQGAARVIHVVYSNYGVE